MDLTELLKNIQRFCKEELGLDVSLSELSKDGGICNALIRQKRKINGTTYQVCTVGEESGPHKTGRTEDMQVVYSCILHFEICERRENINEIK